MPIGRFDAAGASVWRKWPALVAASLAIAFAAQAIAQAPAAAGGAVPALSATYLEQLVGPIALYPDDLNCTGDFDAMAALARVRRRRLPAPYLPANHRRLHRLRYTEELHEGIATAAR